MSKDWYADVPRSTRGQTLYGIAVLAVSVFGFGFWGSTAQIAGAVVAAGAFVTTGQNKIVQHLEGGVIREIRVREGDVVEEGQVLIVLDETEPLAELRRIELRHARLQAIEARLRAEMDDADEVTFPPALLNEARRDPDVAEIVSSQAMTHGANMNSLRSEITTLETGIDALEERIAGAEVQLEATRSQVRIIEEELVDKRGLLEKGLVRRPEVLALQRSRAGLQGEIGRLIGDIGDAKERIARIREQIAGVRNNAIRAAVENLHEARAELKDLRERLRSAANVLQRVQIVAPDAGVVVKLRYHTSGGVIEAGKPILEIVPSHEDLIIEVKVRPQDVDAVRTGQEANVRLTALNKRTTPSVEGEVVYVSADALPDDRRPTTGDENYIARVALDKSAAAAIEDFTPTPGMPAEVYIKTSERTFLEYLVRPLKDSMARAFREE